MDNHALFKKTQTNPAYHNYTVTIKTLADVLQKTGCYVNSTRTSILYISTL